MRFKNWLLLLIGLIAGIFYLLEEEPFTPSFVGEADYTIYFPVDRYPETAQHIRDAVAKGLSDICTIDREGADKQRSASLQGIPTRKGYDRDEWPMAMCEEGGAGADIAYISPSDNRGAGSWVGNQLQEYPNGTRVRIVVN
ncbi:hypothetical protein EBB07_26940 [Paenibacillaceae bacterium]|nr:hypothetical protein EBB07_26940 [Paenibacillaceae bacterium]